MSTADIDSAWDDLEHALAEKIPQVFDNLNPGATAADFRQLEETIGFPLPEAFKHFYGRHNGHLETEEISYGFSVRSPRYASQKDYLYTDYFMFSLIFIPVFKPDNQDADIWDTSIVDLYIQKNSESWEVRDRYIDELDFVGPVKPKLWHDRWVPICASGEGDFVCVDYDPLDGGTLGQVIYCNHSSGGFVQVIASSLAEYLQMQAEDLRQGLITVTRSH
jgi:cell wall assembly regulator SMI1